MRRETTTGRRCERRAECLWCPAARTLTRERTGLRLLQVEMFSEEIQRMQMLGMQGAAGMVKMKQERMELLDEIVRDAFRTDCVCVDLGLRLA
jgi:hypothetical protein